MNKIINLLQLIAKNAVIQKSEKSDLKLYSAEYDLLTEMTLHPEDIVQITFLMANNNNISVNTKLEDIKSFLINLYDNLEKEHNYSILEKVGIDKYKEWIERDYATLNEPKIMNGINKISIETEGAYHNIIKEDSETGLNEGICLNPTAINEDAKNLLSCIKISSFHFIKDNEMFKIQPLELFVPVCNIQNYIYLNQMVNKSELKNYDDINVFFNKLMDLNNNKKLAVTLEYINLDNILKQKIELPKNSKKKKI